MLPLRKPNANDLKGLMPQTCYRSVSTKTSPRKMVQEARTYIANYWKKVERFHPKDDESLLGAIRALSPKEKYLRSEFTLVFLCAIP